MKVAILGASGKTGIELVRQAGFQYRSWLQIKKRYRKVF